ncbi:hypothetical protein [Bradyrhizobium sp. Y36]|uniref:hypothetical protein n=1 Tax=Bradyrhizobium sp. Y36 TaxID=2035447 RepID=UPI000BE79961|nr:hypothetical protein [Bradyrhizobium sp. Y36]
MNRAIIHIWSCAAVGVALFSVGEAQAACDPPRDMRDCARIPKEVFAQENPALPEPPFLVTYPGTTNQLALTNFDLFQSPDPVPGGNGCHPLNQSACAAVSSADLTKSKVAKKSTPFVVRFQNGRSLLAAPVAAAR